MKQLIPFVLFGISLAYNVPEYTPYQKSLSADSFFEQFDYESLESSSWIPSKATKFDGGRRENVAYHGKWAIEPSRDPIGYNNDRGLVMTSEASHYAISHKLPQPFDNTANDLVLQYELKVQNGMSCSGAYIKLLDVQEDYVNFSSDTPYQVMFGPDRCGSDNKVHFIIRRTNPHTEKSEEKHLRTPPMAKNGELSGLYTLIIRKNQDFEIRINGQVAKAGNMLTTRNILRPALNPPEEILDVNDVKPLDWDDRTSIPDPNIVKPEDYDLKHSLTRIPDLSAKKPEDWDESKPAFIQDENSEKPDYWDDEEDGEWELPSVPNPECIGLSGCGKWNPPTIVNPHYIGPWIHPKIENPNYKGEWEPRMIPNPHFFEDKRPSDLKPIGGIGFDLWSMDSGLSFNNIYLGHSVSEAESIGNETWQLKYELEYAYKVAHPKADIKKHAEKPPPDFEDLLFCNPKESQFSQFRNFLRMTAKRQFLEVKDFLDQFLMDPVNTIITQPIRFVIYCVLFVTVFSISFSIWAVVMFLITNWGQTQEEQEEEDKETEVYSGPKIEELEDDDPEVKASSVEVHASDATQRKR